MNTPAAQPVQPGSEHHQALPSSPSASAGQQHEFPKAPAQPNRQQPGAQPEQVAAGSTPAAAERGQDPAAEAHQPGRHQLPRSASHLSGSMQQQGPGGRPAASTEAAGLAGQPRTVVKPQVKRKKPTGPLWARASLAPPVPSSTPAAASRSPEARGDVPVAPAATPSDAGASAAQSPALGSAVPGAALDAGNTPLPMLPGAGHAEAEAAAAQGTDHVLADKSIATLQPPEKHDAIRAQKHAVGKGPPLLPQHGAPAEQQQQQPSTACAAAAAASPASTEVAADAAAAPLMEISTEQQQQPSTSCAAAAAAAASPVLIGTEQQRAASTNAAAGSAAAPSLDISPAPSDASHPVMASAHDGSLPVDAELDMFAEPDQQPTMQRGAALRRQQELAQALGQVAASAPGVVLPAEPQPRQGAPSMKAPHAAAPQGVQRPTVTACAQGAPAPQGTLPALPAGAGTVLCSRQAPKQPNPAAAAPQCSEQVLPPSAASAPSHAAAAAGAGKASSSRQSPQQGDAEPGPPSSPQKQPKPTGWKTVGTWQAGEFMGLKSPLSPSTGPLQPAGTSSAGQAAAAAAEAAAGAEGSLPAPPLGQQQAGGARSAPAWYVDCPGGSSVPQRQQVLLQMTKPGRLLGVPALAELRVVWTQMRGRLWPSSGAWATPGP